MNNLEEILNLKNEIELLKEKLIISQSFVKLGLWEFDSLSKQIFLSEEAHDILDLKSKNKHISISDFIEITGIGNELIIYDDLKGLIIENKSKAIEIQLKSGNDELEKWIKIIADSSMHSKKNPNLIIGIIQDISEQKKNEKLLKKAKDKAEEADFLKSAFLANMSHEIRTPLNAILGFSQLLTNPNIPSAQRNEYSQYITSSANNLLNLVRDIVDISKIEAGKMVIEKKDCYVNEVLKELKFTFEKEKESQSKSNIEIKLNNALGDEDCSIVTDPFRFHQIMVNLIGNALKFIEEGYIEFGYLFVDRAYLQFYVKDTGIGIPNDKIDLIFSRFGQIIDTKIKNPGGTGLGLSITKHLVERLGGKIWVDSEPGVGTTFYFTLPYEKSELKNTGNINQSKGFDDIQLKNIRILAVEDDPINMVLLEDTLKLEIKDLHFVKAFNGIEAIEKLSESDFDLIIMDVRMPKMDGYEATNIIRLEMDHPKNKIPILGLSAHALKDEIERGKQIGMNDFLSKPIVSEVLVSKIKEMVLGLKEQIIETEKPVPEQIEKGKSKILDIGFLDNLLKSNTEKIKKTLKVYQEQIPAQLLSMNEACDENNFDKLHTISHSLKSTFKYLGRSDLSEIAREIELEIDPRTDKDLVLSRIQSLKDSWKVIDKAISETYFIEME